jgi:hypothetical protein
LKLKNEENQLINDNSYYLEAGYKKKKQTKLDLPNYELNEAKKKKN